MQNKSLTLKSPFLFSYYLFPRQDKIIRNIFQLIPLRKSLPCRLIPSETRGIQAIFLGFLQCDVLREGYIVEPKELLNRVYLNTKHHPKKVFLPYH